MGIVMIAMVPLMMVVVMGIDNDHYLRLRHVGNREAEDENQSGQRLFHLLRMSQFAMKYGATLTYVREAGLISPSRMVYASSNDVSWLQHSSSL
jgi:hypothetical protein